MNIYCKLARVQQKLRVNKDQRNDFGKYNYRSAEQILEAVKPLLYEEGLIIWLDDEMELIGDRYYLKANVHLRQADGNEELIATARAREEFDVKGQIAAQVTGACSSYARKYALCGLFAIDDSRQDPDSSENTKARQALTAEELEKFKLFILDHGLTVTEFCNRHGIHKLTDLNYDQVKEISKQMLKDAREVKIEK